MYTGQWPQAFPDNPTWVPSRFFYDSTHQTLNNTEGSLNFIVIQSSQGECMTQSFNPPNTQYWVVNSFTVTNNNQVLLYNVYFPGWSACLRTNQQTGKTYYQVRYFPCLWADNSYIIRTLVPDVRLLISTWQTHPRHLDINNCLVDAGSCMRFLLRSKRIVNVEVRKP